MLILACIVHGGAPFLPWHRYFSWVYIKTLREECGYDGPGVYWDWTQDTQGLRLSAVMSAETGFGGDGSKTRIEDGPGGQKLQCVSDGPFAELRPEWLAVNPKSMVGGGHCFYRDLPEVSEPQAFESMATTIGAENIAKVQQHDNWADFKWELEGGPHGVIHASLGGEMNPTTSPNGACLPQSPSSDKRNTSGPCTGPHSGPLIHTVKAVGVEPLLFGSRGREVFS